MNDYNFNNNNNPFNTYKPNNEVTPLVTPEVNQVTEEPLQDKKKFTIKKQYIIGGLLIVLLLLGFTVLLFLSKNDKHKMNAKTDVVTTIVTNEAGEVVVIPDEVITNEAGEEVTTSTEVTEVITNEAGEVLETITSNTTNSTSKPTTTKPVISIKVDSTHNTVSALKSANVKVGNTVKTNGYASSGDGGEAYYTIEAKNKQTIDDGKYIELNNGLVANLMAINNTYNAKQFGAKGNGSTDDTEALKKATKIISNETLYIPSGTYMVSGPVSFSNKTSGKITGDGDNTVIKAVGGMSRGTTMIQMTNVNNVSITNITISGNSSVNTRDQGHDDKDGIHPLDIWGGSNITIDNIKIMDNIYVALRLIKDISNIKITNSKFINVDCGVEVMGSGNIDNYLIQNCLIDGHKNSEPVSFFGTGRYTNIRILNNTIRNKRYAGAIYLGGFPDTGAYFENVYVIGNKINDVSTGIVLNNGHNCHIENNIIDNSSFIHDGGGSGIKLAGCDNVEIKGNKVSNIVQMGMLLNGNSNLNVHDNTFTNCGYANNDFFFVDIRGENTNVVFTKNTLTRTDESLHRILLMSHATSGTTITNNIINNGIIQLYTDSSNNYLDGNNGAEISDRGTNNTIVR